MNKTQHIFLLACFIDVVVVIPATLLGGTYIFILLLFLLLFDGIKHVRESFFPLHIVRYMYQYMTAFLVRM